MPEKETRGHRSRKTAEQYLAEAANLEEQGLFEEAIAKLERAARVSTDKVPIYREIADLCRSQRLMEDAIAALRKAIRLKPNDVQAREALLEILLELGRYDDTINEARELLKISPRSLLARDVLSIAYIQKGMLDKALQVTNELIKLDPTSPINHFKKAVLYQQKGDIGNAIYEFSRVVEMEPDGEIARDAQQAIDTLDSYQLRSIVMLAVEDYIFRAKLIRDPEAAARERGYHLSVSGFSALRQIQFDELPEIYDEWKHTFYH